MKHLTQTRKYNCSQTCLAMITNQNIKEVEKDLGTTEVKNGDICKYAITKKVVRKNEDICKKKRFLPLNCLVIVYFEEYKDDKAQNSYIIVRRNGKFYDPNGETYYIQPKRHISTFYVKYTTQYISFSRHFFFLYYIVLKYFSGKIK